MSINATIPSQSSPNYDYPNYNYFCQPNKEPKNISFFKEENARLNIRLYKIFSQNPLNCPKPYIESLLLESLLYENKPSKESNKISTESNFENKIESLKNLYIITDELEVYQYLSKNLSLYEYLEEANINIKKIFGELTSLVLRLDTDPEIPDYQKILIIIQTNLSPDEVYFKIKQLNSKWFLHLPFNILKRLSIDVEFE